MAQGGEMFVEGQDSVKKELVKRFSSENFAWIDDILPEEEEGEDEQEEERIDDIDRVPAENVIDIGNADVIETHEVIPPL